MRNAAGVFIAMVVPYLKTGNAHTDNTDTNNCHSKGFYFFYN